MTDWAAKMSCRNTKKPTKAKWFLGEECAENAAVKWKGRVPRMSWIMNDKIKRWGITWRDSTPTNASESLGINGDLGSALMMSHGMTLLSLREVQDEFFPFALAALVAVHLIQAGDGEDDYVAVVLDATLCHMEMCAGAQERGLQFPEGFAEDCDEVLVAFSSVEASMEQVNKECALLGQCFPYSQDPLLYKISEDKIHLAPDSLKYRMFVERRKDQVQLEAEALGTIRRKPELYCVPLKRAPVKGGGPEDEEEGLILQSMPAKDMQYLIEGQTIPWYQVDVHWYIVGGQHMYQACVNIAKKQVPGSARHKFYIEFDVIPVYSRDPDMLIKVSNALNIQVKEKDVSENFGPS